MRSILESYDSELSHTDYSPQFSKRLREVEDILQKTQSHHVEMEVQGTRGVGFQCIHLLYRCA